MVLAYRLTSVYLVAFVLIGCQSSHTHNPSFDVTWDEAAADLRRMRDDMRPLQRPVVILGGFLDAGLGPWDVGRRLDDYFNDDRVVKVDFVGCEDFDECRQRVIAAVDERFPNDGPVFTTEVDVLGISMGGVVARYAAGRFGERRLRVRQLITYASPHAGAKAAEYNVDIALRADLRQSSSFIAKLNSEPLPRNYDLVP